MLEALFCGAVPIVSKFAGSSELVTDYKVGVIINPLDIKGTAGAVTDLLNDNQKLSEFKVNATKMLSDGSFTIRATVKKTLDIYREVIW